MAMGGWLAGSREERVLAQLVLLAGAARMGDTTASLRTSGDPLSEWLGRVQVNLPNQTVGGKPGSSGYTVNLDDLTCSAHPARNSAAPCCPVLLLRHYATRQ